MNLVAEFSGKVNTDQTVGIDKNNLDCKVLLLGNVSDANI